MIYSQIYLKNKVKIPSIIVLLLILIIIFVFISIFTKSTVTSKASITVVKRVNETNLLPNQVTIFWQTARKESGCVFLYNQYKQLVRTSTFIFHDERDLEQNKYLFYNHYATLKELDKGKKYFYKLGGGNKKACLTQYDSFYSFTTPETILPTSNFQPACGKVIQSNGGALVDAIVILSISNIYPVSVRTKSKGEWVIPISNFYAKDTLKPLMPKINEQVTIEIISEELKSSLVTTDFSQVSPLPQTIIIGNKYNFKDNVLAITDTIKYKAASQAKDIDILFPQADAVIPGRKPLIKGIAKPNREVLVIVEAIRSFSTKIISDKDGLWKVIPPIDLDPGEYKITAITEDSQNKQIKIQRKFYIAKSGEGVLGQATAEPTITAPELSVTPSPTSEILSTPTSTPVVAGTNYNNLIFGSISLVVIGLGLMLAF